MVIACEDFGDRQRIDPGTLPPFNNASRCAACGSRWPIRVLYSPGSASVAGPHFTRECVACGARWNERSTFASSAASPLGPLPSATA